MNNVSLTKSFYSGVLEGPMLSRKNYECTLGYRQISNQKVFIFMLVTHFYFTLTLNKRISVNVNECYLISLFILAFHRLSLAVWRCGGLTLPKRDDRIFSFPLRKGRKCVFFSTMSAIRMCFIAAGIQ